MASLIAQGAFAIFILLFRKDNNHANRFLSLLIGLFALWLCDSFFRVSGIYESKPEWYFSPIFYSLAFGPLLYLYTRAMTVSDFKWKSKYLVHFIPAIVQGIFYVFMRFKDYEFRRSFWFEVHRPITYDLEFNLTLLSLLIYSIISIRLISNYQKWIKNQYSEISHIHLKWLRIVQLMFILITFFWLLDALMRELLTYYPNQPASAMILGIAMLFLAAGALLQIDQWDKRIITESELEDDQPLGQSRAINPMTLQTIKAAMSDNEYYLDPDLTLKTFAKNLNIPPRIVSIHLNEGLNKTFIDFVNEYRVDKVQQLIRSGESSHLSLFGIALESGFNSKSTFNRVFKKWTGQSPSSFQKVTQNKV